MCMYVYVYAYKCVYIYIYTHMYIHISIYPETRFTTVRVAPSASVASPVSLGALERL